MDEKCRQHDLPLVNSGALDYRNVLLPQCFADEVQTAGQRGICMDRLRFAIELVRGLRKSLICIRPV